MYIRAFGPLVLRVALGVVFIAHGLPKLTGSDAAVTYLESLGLPPVASPAIGVVETGGGVALLAGAATVIVAPLLALDMLFAAIQSESQHGFFINWAMTPGVGHGYEYHFVLIAALVCLALGGP